MEMKIEVACRKDVPALLELQHRAFGPMCRKLGLEETPISKQTLENAYEVFDDCTTLKVENLDGRIIGSVQGNVTNEMLYIGRLMVAPEYQHRGIGTQLFREIQKQMPHNKAWLFTCQDIKKTYAFYQREGFKTFEVEKAGSGLTWAYMEKEHNTHESQIDTVEIRSDILGKTMAATVYVPTQQFAILPVLYLMHGRSGDEKMMYQLDIKDVADKLIAQNRMQPMLIVCPRMDDALGLHQYEDYFFCEVAPLIESRYRTCQRYIGGFSAGGYIAINYAMRHPAMFQRVGGHMPAIEEDLDDNDLHYFGTKEEWAKNNPLFMAKDCPLPPNVEFYLDTGSDDEGGFYEGCAQLATILYKRGYHVINYLNTGHHDVSYVKKHLKEYLMFYAPTNN